MQGLPAAPEQKRAASEQKQAASAAAKASDDTKDSDAKRGGGDAKAAAQSKSFEEAAAAEERSEDLASFAMLWLERWRSESFNIVCHSADGPRRINAVSSHQACLSDLIAVWFGAQVSEREGGSGCDGKILTPPELAFAPRSGECPGFAKRAHSVRGFTASGRSSGSESWSRLRSWRTGPALASPTWLWPVPFTPQPHLGRSCHVRVRARLQIRWRSRC